MSREGEQAETQPGGAAGDQAKDAWAGRCLRQVGQRDEPEGSNLRLAYGRATDTTVLTL